MINKKTKSKVENEEININIDKTVDDLLKCWNSRIQFQNYMKQIDFLVLGGLDKEREQLVRSNEFLEGPEIGMRNDFDSIAKNSKKRYDEEMFRSSMGKMSSEFKNIGDNQRTNKKLDINLHGSFNKLNDLLSNSKLNNIEGPSKNQSIDINLSNEEEWNERSIKNNVVSNRKK